MQVAGLLAPKKLGSGDVYPKSTCFLTEGSPKREIAMIDRERDCRFKKHKNEFKGPVDADLFSNLGKFKQLCPAARSIQFK